MNKENITFSRAHLLPVAWAVDRPTCGSIRDTLRRHALTAAPSRKKNSPNGCIDARVVVSSIVMSLLPRSFSTGPGLVLGGSTWGNGPSVPPERCVKLLEMNSQAHNSPEKEIEMDKPQIPSSITPTWIVFTLVSIAIMFIGVVLSAFFDGLGFKGASFGVAYTSGCLSMWWQITKEPDPKEPFWRRSKNDNSPC